MSTGVGTLTFGERIDERFIREGSPIQPSSFDVLKANAVFGFNRIFPFQLVRLAAFNVAPLIPGLASETLNSEEWLSSPYFREGIDFVPGMTKLRAFMLAEEHDKEKAWREISERGPTGVKGIALSLVGELLGSVPDPLNFVPIVGHGSKVRMINRIAQAARGVAKNQKLALSSSRLIGSGLAGGIDAAVATSIFTPVYLSERRTLQQDALLGGAIINIGIATAIGTGAGTVIGYVQRKMRFNNLMKAQRTAAAQIVDGKNVDVNDIVKHDMGTNPLADSTGPEADIRFDVAQDPPRIENTVIADDFNKFQQGIVPEDDITLARQIAANKEQFKVRIKDTTKSLDTLERSGVPVSALIRLVKDPDRLRGLADDIQIVEGISQMRASGVPAEDIAELIINNPKLLKEISNDFRRIRDISPTAARLRAKRVELEVVSKDRVKVQRKELEAKSIKEVNAIAKKEGIAIRLLANRKKSTVIGAIIDKREIELGRPAELIEPKLISDVVPERKKMPDSVIKREQATALINVKMAVQAESRPGKRISDLPESVVDKIKKLDKLTDIVVVAKTPEKVRTGIRELAKTLNTDEFTAEALVKFNASRKGVQVPGLSDTPPPANRVSAQLDDTLANIDRQLQDHLDTVAKIEKNVDQRQDVIQKYIDCLMEK